MFQSRKPVPMSVPGRAGASGRINTFNAQAFFEAIPSDRERAMSMLGSQVSDDGPPTPRAQTYIDLGEWDNGVLLQLTFIGIDPCTGRVGSVTESDVARFCGLGRSECTSRSHLLSVRKLYRPGWRIPGGNHKGAGFFRGPSLPSADAGGPITATIAQSLRLKTDPFALSAGQWKFVINKWIIWKATSNNPEDGAFSFETEAEGTEDLPVPATLVTRNYL
jgi:hypothetical protein